MKSWKSCSSCSFRFVVDFTLSRTAAPDGLFDHLSVSLSMSMSSLSIILCASYASRPKPLGEFVRDFIYHFDYNYYFQYMAVYHVISVETPKAVTIRHEILCATFQLIDSCTKLTNQFRVCAFARKCTEIGGPNEKRMKGEESEPYERNWWNICIHSRGWPHTPYSRTLSVL